MNKAYIKKVALDIVTQLRKQGQLYLRNVDFKKLTWIVNSKKNQFFTFMTMGIILLGIIFGSIIKGFLESEEQVGLIQNLDQIYVVYLGTFETFDEVLSIQGEARKLGYEIDINLEEDQYTVYSHIVGTVNQLEEVKLIYNEHQVEHIIHQLENEEDDLGWSYFFKAVHQIPYEMDPDFIEEFAQDELFIWGYYVALATDSLESLSEERQQMLREIYQWLNN